MITIHELQRWLTALADDFGAGCSVGISDDGLTMRMVENERAYIEIGGLPLEDEGDA